MSTPIWMYALSMSMYFLFLLALIHTMRKHYKFATIFWLCSLLTFPLWLMGGVTGWFRWAKTLSILLPIIVFSLIRIANYENRSGKFWEAFKKPWTMWFLYGILFLNIMEATIKDYSTGNLFNALCGFLLCVTIPYPLKYWKVSKEKHGDLVAYTTIFWNFAYTTWNLCFVYGESGAYFASSVCILLAAEIYPIIVKRPELYITARVYTLAIHLLIRACAPGLFPAVMDASTWQNTTVLYYWGLANVIITIPFVFWHTWQLHTGKAELSFRRGKAAELDRDLAA